MFQSPDDATLLYLYGSVNRGAGGIHANTFLSFSPKIYLLQTYHGFSKAVPALQISMCSSRLFKNMPTAPRSNTAGNTKACRHDRSIHVMIHIPYLGVACTFTCNIYPSVREVISPGYVRSSETFTVLFCAVKSLFCDHSA